MDFQLGSWISNWVVGFLATVDRFPTMVDGFPTMVDGFQTMCKGRVQLKNMLVFTSKA